MSFFTHSIVATLLFTIFFLLLSVPPLVRLWLHLTGRKSLEKKREFRAAGAG